MRTALDQPWAAWELANHNGEPKTLGHYQPWLASGGWAALRRQIDVAYLFGFRVFFIHRPFGEEDIDDVMDADSRVDLADHPLVKTYDAFQATLLRDYPDLHLVVYVGSLRDTDLSDRLKRNEYAAWIDRLRRSYLPLLDHPRVHIGLDHAVTYPTGHPMMAWCELLKSLKNLQGAECVIESLPRADQQGYVGFVTEGAWHEHPEARTLPTRGGARWWNGKAEWMRLFDRDPRKWLADCKATGATPCIDWRLIEAHKLSYAEVAGEAA